MGDPLYLISSSEVVGKLKESIAQEAERLIQEANSRPPEPKEPEKVKSKKTSSELEIIPEEIAVFDAPNPRILATPKRTINASSKIKPARNRKTD
jgi:hypothetical protein